ncbi:MAG TPA: S8 family serine peptidase [Steroidobacteraceae bacterium]
MNHAMQVLARSVTVVLLLGASAVALAEPVPDTPDSVLTATKTGAYAKIGPFLGNLYDEFKEAQGKGVKASSFKSSDPVMRIANGTVAIDLYAADAAALTNSLKALGATRVDSRGPLVSARVPVASLGAIAALPSLRYARPVMATTSALPPTATSQGDTTLRAPAARATFGVNGAGVPVGILSDSYACNPPPFNPGQPSTTFAQDKGKELPATVTILKDGPCPATDEGRGMGQIVYDVAPGSPQLFHTAFESEFDFAEGIIRLADAGAKVIVDDVSYFAEPMFSDGMVAQATDIVTDRGVSYFTSAGNQARASYESDLRPVNVLTNSGKNLNGGAATIRRFHDFDPGPGVSILQPVFLQPGTDSGLVYVSFQWDQPHLTATTYARLKAGQDPALAVGATSDLDLVFFDYKGHVIRNCPPGVARGITCQITGDRNIGGDAVDVGALYYSGPPKVAQLFYIGFVVSGGPDPAHVKYSVFEQDGTFGMLAFDTRSGTAWGHSNPAKAQSIGAASWYATVPFSTSGVVPPNDAKTPKIDLSPCDPGCLNDFSSAGNVPIYLDKFGARLATPERRKQPSVTGPDGGNSSFFISDSSYDDDDGNGINSPFSTFISGLDLPGNEYPNFFGTSASAPHVAAVAALMRQKNPSITPAQVRSILEATARPIAKRFTSNRPLIVVPITPNPVDGYNDDAGAGLVDAFQAVSAAGP